MLPYTTYNIPQYSKGKTTEIAKWLWFVVSAPLSASEVDLLYKISSALKAEYDNDVHCFQQDPSTPNAIDHASYPDPKLIISFGVLPADLGIWIDLHRPGYCRLESFTFILTLPLDTLSGNASAKKELWKSMQLFLEQH